VFDSESGRRVGVLEDQTEAVRLVASNPKYEVLASGCSQTTLWTTTLEERVVDRE